MEKKILKYKIRIKFPVVVVDIVFHAHIRRTATVIASSNTHTHSILELYHVKPPTRSITGINLPNGNWPPSPSYWLYAVVDTLKNFLR